MAQPADLYLTNVQQFYERPGAGQDEPDAQGISEQPSEIASVRYQAYLAAGVERWKEYREQLSPLGKKPVLFVMMNDTADADDVGDWLKTKYPSEFRRGETTDYPYKQIR